MNKFTTLTYLRNACGIKRTQEIEFESWLAEYNFQNISNRSEYAEWDNIGQSRQLWNKYQQGTPPWQAIVYFNHTAIINLEELCFIVDQWAYELIPNGWIYLALNKWCVNISNPDFIYKDMSFDDALSLFVSSKLKNLSVKKYQYIPNDRGGLGNWIHGNNRFWLQRNE